MKNNLFIIYLFLSISNITLSQTGKKISSSIKEFEKQQQLIASSKYKSLEWRSIGPDFKSGRATDICGITNNYNVIYAAFASGGLWKTEDGGNNWKSLFDQQATLSIGTLAVYEKDPNIIYIGTGEANILRASLPGTGIYKSIDGGKTIQNIGLVKSGTIARIIIDPNNVNHVYVAVSGNEWNANEERGVYETKDGGKNWKRILFESKDSGCIDLVIDPNDSNILYASMWNRIRKRWSDPTPKDGDHIYKTVDGGKTWKIINKGLPLTSKTGRIGLAVSNSNPNVVYAFVDDHNKKRDPKDGETDSYERKVQKVVIGGAVYKSINKGETWEKQGEIHDFFKPFSGTYGWVFGQIRVNPKNENEVYVLGVSMGKSTDGGKTWEKFGDKDDNIHGDNHGMWIDKNNTNRILLANDGGVSHTLDAGKTWKNFFDKIPTTQFYTVTYDMETPFNIYGAVQDEGTLGGNSDETFGMPKNKTLKKWNYAPGGEGTQIRVDTKNNNIIYSCSYYGRLMKTDISDPEKHKVEKFKTFDVGRIDSLRGEWLAGTIISKYNNKVIYHGLQHLYQSKDEGATWTKISPDLSYNDKSKMGVYPYLIYHQAITCIEEGDNENILYAGTDDGRVWKTQNQGKSWIEITNGLPKNKHVIKIVSSRFNPKKVYVALNDRRSDNNTPYVYVSEDNGKTWKLISNNLPQSPVNVIIEDLDDNNVLYCGTDFGPYVSKDSGKSWISLTGNLPQAISVNDMFIHPRDKKLVIGTYGRGIYIIDDLKVLK